MVIFLSSFLYSYPLQEILENLQKIILNSTQQFPTTTKKTPPTLTPGLQSKASFKGFWESKDREYYLYLDGEHAFLEGGAVTQKACFQDPIR